MVGVVKWCLWQRWLVCLCLFCLTVCALGETGASRDGLAVSTGEVELLFEDDSSALFQLNNSELQRKEELEKLLQGRVEARVLEEGIEGGNSKHFFPHNGPSTSTSTKPPEKKPKPKPKPKPYKPYGEHPNAGPPIEYPPKKERDKEKGHHKHKRKHHQHKD